MTTNTEMFGTVLHGETARDIRIEIPPLTMQIRPETSGMHNKNQREIILSIRKISHFAGHVLGL